MDLSTPLVKQCSKTPKVTFKESSSSSPHEPISTLARQDLFSCLLPLCYRNTPTQVHPARCRLLRFLVFLLRYMLLGLLSLGSGASLNQRANILPMKHFSRVFVVMHAEVERAL